MTKPVCLVIGAGAGIGGNVAKRFAREGYHAVLARRSDKAGLDRLVDEIKSEGGSATGFMLNAVEEGSIERLVESVEADIGPIEVAVFNLGAQIGSRALADTTLKQFEVGWRMATFGLFRLARVLFPYMEARGKGAMIVTSATAAMRGNAGQHSHTSAMAGRRMLCQSLNAEFAAKFPGVRGYRNDGFTMLVGYPTVGSGSAMPVTRKITFKSYPSRHECNAKCLNGKHNGTCECKCGGKNHGAGMFTKLLEAA